eukprot:gnl/TRDRNA2_/TRDRNA2_174471_c0_seq1.p1 gnl/TRDRNA2_/TRDRNA2_174471_c0~~gnl/TRDRNA2_/TRDRNA2_174471_c0_seq1.p1  ORF type:complete len:639 (-),score=99.03 gnl/TRDRNA2_/TRDRNA2_174471_c0_seq1:115-1836(-)
MLADPTYEEEVQHIAEQMESMMADPMLKEQPYLTFKDWHSTDKSVAKLVDRVQHRSSGRHAALDDTALAKSEQPTKTPTPTTTAAPTKVPNMVLNWMSGLKDIHVNRYMDTALGYAVILGLFAPILGQTVAAPMIGNWRVAPTCCLAYIFFLQGAALQNSEIKKAFSKGSHVFALLYGIINTLGTTALISMAVNQLPFLSRELKTGFTIWSNMGITLSGGMGMAAAAGGNAQFAPLVIVLSNIIGCFTVPFSYQFYLSSKVPGAPGININPYPLLVHYSGTCITATVLGKLMSFVPPFMRLMSRSKTFLSYSSNTAMAMMPWMAISLSVQGIYALQTHQLLYAVATQVAVHCTFLLWSYVTSGLLQLPMDIRKSLTFASAQKTLPLCMITLGLLPPELGTPLQRGQIALPCILGRLTQYIVGMHFVAQRMNKGGIPEQQRKKDEKQIAMLEALKAAEEGRTDDAMQKLSGAGGEEGALAYALLANAAKSKGGAAPARHAQAMRARRAAVELTGASAAEARTQSDKAEVWSLQVISMPTVLMTALLAGGGVTVAVHSYLRFRATAGDEPLLGYF